jgi:Cys-tRNA(Pro)/Cys-tRNA(Cys) deacylase
MPPTKTNAARLLESMSIAFELRSYEFGEEHFDAVAVAGKVGLPPEQVYKTLVARGDRNGPLFAVISAECELDLKALARATGDRQVELVALREVQPLTGYVRGGVTALASKKSFPVVADELIELFDTISVSAGTRGTQILLAPADYLRATGAKVAPIARGKG